MDAPRPYLNVVAEDAGLLAGREHEGVVCGDAIAGDNRDEVFKVQFNASEF
jgi:hypothetical protein